MMNGVETKKESGMTDDQAPVAQLSAAEFAALRSPRATRPVRLSDHAIDWILYLPAEVRPQILSQRYPRIANILAEAWLNPQKFKIRLEEFLYDKRPNRQGFPEEVSAELVR